MKANELRIGNWVMYNSKIQVNENKIRECVDHPDRFTQITLTEEWLIKFGFRKYKNGYIITPSMGMDYGYVIEHYEWRGDWAFGILYYDPAIDCDIDEVYNFCGTGLKYVNQLQNIFHALTGEELTIKTIDQWEIMK
jgi:hypothetical protein